MTPLAIPSMPLFYYGIPSRSDRGWIMAQMALFPAEQQQAVADEYNANYLKYGQIHSNAQLKKRVASFGGPVPALTCDKRNLQAQLIIAALPSEVRESAIRHHQKIHDEYNSEKALAMLYCALDKHQKEGNAHVMQTLQ